MKVPHEPQGCKYLLAAAVTCCHYQLPYSPAVAALVWAPETSHQKSCNHNVPGKDMGWPSAQAEPSSSSRIPSGVARSWNVLSLSLLTAPLFMMGEQEAT